jgi:hypothetical protein
MNTPIKRPSQLIRLMGAAYERHDFLRVSALFLELKKHPSLPTMHIYLEGTPQGIALEKAVTASSLEISAYNIGLALSQGLVKAAEVNPVFGAHFYLTKDDFLQMEPIGSTEIRGTIRIKNIAPQEHLVDEEYRREYLQHELLPDSQSINVPGIRLHAGYFFRRSGWTVFVTDANRSDLFYVCQYQKDSNQTLPGLTVKMVWRNPKVKLVDSGSITKAVYLNYLLKKKTKELALVADDIQSDDAIRVWEQVMRQALASGLAVGAGRLDSSKRSYCPADKFDAWYKRAKVAVYNSKYKEKARFFISNTYQIPRYLERANLSEVFPNL